MLKRTLGCALRVAAAALFFVIASCGGGGGASSSGPITPAPPTPLRTDLLYGYFAGCVDDIIEQADHVNLYWATGMCSSSGTWFLDMAHELTTAKAAGIRNVVITMWPNMVWGPGARDEAKFQFQHLAATGALDGWSTIVVYPQDEPERSRQPSGEPINDDLMTAANVAIRAAMATVPQLAGAKLGVIYNCATLQPPGLKTFDWVGCDAYEAGCGAASGTVIFALSPAQRVMVVPGGADPWRQDPACFLSYAETHPNVVAVIPFIWQTADGHTGIRENPTRPLYCAAGRTITGNTQPC